MAETKEPLKCPVCQGGIIGIANTTRIRCEKGDWVDGQAVGCDFWMDRKPKILKGQEITRTEVEKMLKGEEVKFKVGTGRIDPAKPNGFYFVIEFPENGYF